MLDNLTPTGEPPWLLLVGVTLGDPHIWSMNMYSIIVATDGWDEGAVTAAPKQRDVVS